MYEKEKTMQLRLSIVTSQLSKIVPLEFSLVEISICADQLIKNFDLLRVDRSKQNVN